MEKTEIAMTSAIESIDYRISRISGGQSFREKCLGLGLIPGADLQIISKQGKSAAVARIMNTRIMISSGLMDRIYLREV